MAIVRIVVSYVAFALAWPWLRRHPKLQSRALERRARYRIDAFGDVTTPCVWLHGASAGDILALTPTVEALRAHRPNARFVVSAFTDSGCAVAEQSLGHLAQCIALPFDLPHIVARAFDAIEPDVLVLEYAELWPNLLAAAKKRDVAVVLHNGRFTPSNVRAYRWLFWSTGNLLRSMALLLMRDAGEAQRAIELGARPDNVVASGNTKIDHCRRGPPREKIERLRHILLSTRGDTMWVAGSTHAGEEEHVLSAQLSLRTKGEPEPLLLLAPRYSERTDAIIALAESLGLLAQRWTHLQSGARLHAKVVVLDEVGWLFASYALASVVFVGGSFVSRGGQNMIEPASLAVPVLYGPCTHNFAEAVAWLEGQGGTTLHAPTALPGAIAERLRQPKKARLEGERARAAFRRHGGVASRNARSIDAVWARRDGENLSGASV